MTAQPWQQDAEPSPVAVVVPIRGMGRGVRASMQVFWPDGRGRDTLSFLQPSGATVTSRSSIDITQVRVRLAAEREALERLARSTSSDRQAVELDQGRTGRLTRMDALRGQAMALAVAQRREQEILRIDAALKRLDAGEYGYCVTCGEEIGLRRLESDPTTAQCIACARDKDAGRAH
jgi:DnaK suppressor protein